MATSCGHNGHHQAISQLIKLVHTVQDRQFIWDPIYIYINIFIIIIYQVRRFHIFLRPFDNYLIFFFHLSLSFLSSSVNPFSPISPLIPSAQVALGLPRLLLPGGLHFINFLVISPLPFSEHVHTILVVES